MTRHRTEIESTAHAPAGIGTVPGRMVGLVSCSLVALVVVLFLAVASGARAAEPLAPFWTKCESGESAGQCDLPRGIAVDQSTGDVYVVDQNNERIDVFSVWGVFLKAWGWGVATGASEMQQCGPAANPSTTSCQTGIRGGGAGQLATPQGIAIDSEDDLYVIDYGNNRVEKFDREGNFVFALGGDVNKTKVEEVGASETERDLCTAASGDVCQAGVEGSGDDQFQWPFPSNASDYIAVGPSNTVYVGDGGRVQEFTAAGTFVTSVAFPGETVGSIAVDSTGDMYLAYSSPSGSGEPLIENVVKTDPSGKNICTINAQDPMSIAVGPDRNVYVVSGHVYERSQLTEIREFGLACEDLNAAFGGGEFYDEFSGAPGGLTVSDACGLPGVDVYADQPTRLFEGVVESFVRAYGPPPNPDVCPPPVVAPTVIAQYAVSVGDSEGVVAAQINPHFWPDAKYYVEYGSAPCSEGGCTSARPVAPGSGLTSKVVDAPVATAGVLLSGLQPDTTYYYRFVAQSSGGGPVVGVEGGEASFHTYKVAGSGAGGCVNESLRSGLATFLPDCRAYELVSPIEKDGDIAALATSFAQASIDGDRVTYDSLRAFGEVQSAPLESQYLASRDPVSGWSSRSISASRSTVSWYPIGGINFQYKAFSPDLCSGWFVQDTTLPLVAGAPEGPGLYRNKECGAGNEYELLTTVAPTGVKLSSLGTTYYPEVQGSSADGSLTVFRADSPLTRNAYQEGEVFQLYESGNGKSQLVSVLPEGEPETGDSSAGTEVASENSKGLGSSLRDSVFHAVSSDGSRVYWTGKGALYLRVNAMEAQSKMVEGVCVESRRACTYPVSELGPAGTGAARFWSASGDGSRAIFSVVDGPGNKSPGNQELYEFVANEGSGGRLAPEVKLIAGGFMSLLGASYDATHVYFISSEVLTGEQVNSEGAEAQAGKPNMYLYRQGSGFTFIATLAKSESTMIVESDGGSAVGDEAPYRRTSRVSPDGLHVAFTSIERLTGYDNTDVAAGLPDAEVYLYSADTGGVGRLVCASCSPSGARPTGATVGRFAQLTPGVRAAGWLPGWTSEFQPSRYLSDSGDRLFFDSFDALLPHDSNGVEDVYEWEAAGTGTCTEANEDYFSQNGGCLSLISSGESPENSEFFDGSPSGSDAFFATSTSLVPQDPGLVDVYDARVDGGFPTAPRVASCEGEACQAPAVAPLVLTPSSISFSSAGNTTVTGPEPSVKPKTKPLTRAQKLTNALKQCRKRYKRHKVRTRCEAHAHKTHGKSAKTNRRGR